MARIAVTGSEGFIGQHLVKYLKELGHIVYPIDLNYKPEPIDLTSYIDTKRHLEELTDHKTKPIDVLFDLATLPLTHSLLEPYNTVYKIFQMGINLCELCREGYFNTLIHVSSSEVYGTAKEIPMWESHVMMPQSPYAGAKAAQDMIMISYNRAFQTQICIARPFNTYGEGQDLNAIIPATIKRIIKGKRPIIEGDGNQIRDFVYVEDTVRGIIEIFNQQDKCFGRIFNLTAVTPIKIKDLVELICALMKFKKGIEYIEKRPGNVELLLGSGKFTDHILGFKPKISLIDGLQRTIKWWKNQNFTL